MTAHSDDFHAALQVLVGTGAVKQRLVDAYRRHLGSLSEQDLPEAVRDRFIRLRAAMHEAPAAGGMTAPEASARKMSEKDAAEHATAILEMFTVLSALNDSESAPRLRIVANIDDTLTEDLFEVPAFLSRA
jgi:leucyl aminopeptidase (aminopeptidase T)